MNSERIIEIIVKLLTIFQDNKQILNEDLNNLHLLGYTLNEINAAYHWLYRNFLPKENFTDKSYKTSSHRVFHDVEVKVISPE